MASILTVTSGFPSSLYPSVELARRLAAAGHRITFAALPLTRKIVEHHGLGFLPLDPTRYQHFLEQDENIGVVRRFMSLRSRRELAKQSIAVDGFAQAIRDRDPDLVLIDGEMHEHIIAASSAGVRLALLNSFVSIWRQPGLPPPHCLVRPGVGWKGTRVGTSLLWLALRVQKQRSAWLQWVRRMGCDRLSILRHLARETGFDFRRETDEGQWLKPFTYRNLPVLSLHALEFDFPTRPPRGVHYVGPMVLESRSDRPINEKDRERLEAIFERRRRARGERKLIYAGFGSVASTDLKFLQRLCGVFRERPNWDLVISLSDRIPLTDLGQLPERVQAFSWVSQIDVLRHADVVVTHGGINTIDECVLSRVPMLIYCGFQTDMAGNTARVLHHGIGIAGDRRRDSSRVIGEHIDRLLNEPHFETNLNGLKRRYEAYVENRVAERVVASLLASKTERPDRSTGGTDS